MKSVSYIGAVAASLLMLHSCSNEEAWQVEQVPAVYVPGDSEVEIKLGAGSTSLSADEVRAAVVGDADLDRMGIFCLAKAKQDINLAAPDITWFDKTVNWSSCLMNNVEARKEGQTISWLADENYFYPISQFYSYDFYGYYPYVGAESALAYGVNSVRVSYTLDGTQDLIWGRATSTNPYAYSAKFFREEQNKDVVPQLDLKHLLTRLEFFVKPGADTEDGSTTIGASNMEVLSIQVLDVPTQVDMVVADFSRLDMELGDRLELRSMERDSCTLRDADGSVAAPLAVGSDLTASVRMGESMLLYPESEYLVRVKLRNTLTGNVFETENRLMIQSGSFRAGTSYKVTITVHDARLIGLQATLAPWVPAGDADNPEIEL